MAGLSEQTLLLIWMALRHAVCKHCACMPGPDKQHPGHHPHALSTDACAVQIPRLYDIYKAQGLIDNFEQLLDNIFTPLFEVTVDPNSHPQLHLFLKTVSLPLPLLCTWPYTQTRMQPAHCSMHGALCESFSPSGMWRPVTQGRALNLQVVGFDMVDDESKPERRPAKHMKTPEEWDLKHNPAYAYYAFYTYANLYTLNKLREARGLNTFALRPHAGADAPLLKHAAVLNPKGCLAHQASSCRLLFAHASSGACAVEAMTQTIEAKLRRDLILEHLN